LGKNIIGISAFFHDSAACLVVDGGIVAAAQEERFTRKKNTDEFPIQAIQYCLDEYGIDFNQIDAIVFYDKPFKKFERILETYLATAPKSYLAFLKAVPQWVSHKFFIRRTINGVLKNNFSLASKSPPIYFSDHHISHAASAFFCSGFKKSAILTIDGVGEWATATISIGDHKNIEILKEMEFPNSVGLLYSAFTIYLGFKINSGEYKLMGLAPYGDSTSQQTITFIEQIKDSLVEIKEDGSIWMNPDFFTYTYKLKTIHFEKWNALFGIINRKSNGEILLEHCNLALAIQCVTEEIVLKMAAHAKEITKLNNLCLAGGVALNCAANGKLLKSELFDSIYIPSSPGDSGCAVGAALALSNMKFDTPRHFDRRLTSPFLGPSFSNYDIISMNRKLGLNPKFHASQKELIQTASQFISEGKIIGWVQDRMEFGPRSLGNRSILGSASIPEIQHRINKNVKKRESFRPFAPAVLSEFSSEYFDILPTSNYMEFIGHVLPKHRIKPPESLKSKNVFQQLHYTNSKIPSVTHVDYSSRVQIVSKEEHPLFWDLIHAVYEKTGIPMIVNTSFNQKDEPIVCSPMDAWKSFNECNLDALFIGPFMYIK